MSNNDTVSRRAFIHGVAGTAAGGAPFMTAPAADSTGRAGASPAPTGNSAALLQLSAGEAVAHICRGEITAEGYARVLLSRCELLSTLNAFTTLQLARAFKKA